MLQQAAQQDAPDAMQPDTCSNQGKTKCMCMLTQAVEDTIVSWRGGEAYDVGDGSPTGTHGTEGCMSRRVQKGQRRLRPRHHDLKSTNVLQAQTHV